MEIVTLPEYPGPNDLTLTMQDFGGELVPPTGGETQRINRLGNRWLVRVSLPPMLPNVAREWLADVVRAVQFGGRWRLRQVELDVGLPGNPVAAAGQSGYQLAVTGMNPGAAFYKGQAISVVIGGRRYLHILAAHGAADGAGAALLPLTEPLRAPPAANDPVEMAVVYVEGAVAADAATLNINAARRGGLTFTIAERA